jgi:hypothetical protein
VSRQNRNGLVYGASHILLLPGFGASFIPETDCVSKRWVILVLFVVTDFYAKMVRRYTHVFEGAGRRSLIKLEAIKISQNLECLEINQRDRTGMVFALLERLEKALFADLQKVFSKGRGGKECFSLTPPRNFS